MYVSRYVYLALNFVFCCLLMIADIYFVQFVVIHVRNVSDVINLKNHSSY